MAEDFTILDHNGKPIRSEQRDFDIPSILTEESIYSGSMKTFLHGVWDEALRHSRHHALAMARDETYLALLGERIRATTSLKYSLTIDNEDDPWQQAVRDGITQSLNGTRWLRQLFRTHMQALWPGRAGAQCLWDWAPVKVDTPRGQNQDHRVLQLVAHQPINGDKIGWTLSGIPYIQVYGAAQNYLPDAEIINTNESKGLLLVGSWRERVLVSSWNPTDVDFREPERAGAIRGLGLRSALFWNHWCKNEYITSVLKSLDRFGLGFVVIEYDVGNPDAKNQAIKAAKSLSTNRSILVVPVAPGQIASGGVRVVETPTAGCEMMLRLQQACDSRAERLVVGQSGSASTQTSGMGTHDQSFVMQTKSEIVEEDAQWLSEVLTGSEREPGLISIIKKWSYPWADFPVRLVMEAKPSNIEEKLASITMAYNCGVSFVENEVRGLTGMSSPGPGDSVLRNPAFAQQQPPPGADQGQAPPDQDADSDPAFDNLFEPQPPQQQPGEDQLGQEGGAV